MVSIKRPLALPRSLVTRVHHAQKLITALLCCSFVLFMVLFLFFPQYFGKAFARNFAYSLAITSLTSAIATLFALPLAITLLTVSARKLIACLGLLYVPLTISPLALASILCADFIHLSPYGEAVIYVTQFISIFPLAVLLEFFVFDRLSSLMLLHGLQLSLGSVRWTWKAHRSAIIRAGMLSFVLGTGILLADPSLHLVFGGTTPFLSNHILHVLSSGGSQAAAIPHVVSLIVLSVVAAVLLADTLQHSGNNSKAVSDDERAAFAAVPLTRGIGRAGIFVGSIYAALTVFIVVMIAKNGIVHMLSLAQSNVPQAFGQAIWSTTIAVVPVILLAWIFSLYSASIAFWHPRFAAVFNTCMVVFLLISLTTGGILIAFIHQDWIKFGSFYLIPPLVGNAGYGNGYLAIAMSYMSIAFPIAHLVSYSVFESYRPAVLAARDLGAKRTRIFFTIILPTIIPVWIPAFALLIGLLIARNTPAVFVNSASFPQVGPSILNAAEEGHDAAVYALTTSASLLSILLFIVGIAGVLLFSHRRGHYETI
ncbi:ABC-type spermidine/putrescine transport system permease subunit II [Arcanobacterium pluranimalium]|uniref:ABC transporter permease subunit n=1 Tax=Arcanobacterium pluranimalium TaxID=108028 RepID=UPI00195E6A88|nr:ABC transporter permease subunit [Arcanobacterium pluranimalium]MBM7825012.1 ABC-type spermidine/putrescine transport system permease subunit II [Arcanobacterium pluranimalium]